MVAEEVKDPDRNIPIGYISGILTLMLLALGVMILSGGAADWQRLAVIDYPLPETIGQVLGKNNSITKVFAGIGLFGLIASFHGIIISYSRQIFAMARSGFLPPILSQVNKRYQTPHWALIAGGIIGILALYSGTTDKLIILSGLGAIVMYIISMLSLFVLRRKEPMLKRPVKTPFYPYFPGIALLLSCVCLVAIIYYNFWLSILFLVGFGITAILFAWKKKDTVAVTNTDFIPSTKTN
jgi:ethanolamine permease